MSSSGGIRTRGAKHVRRAGAFLVVGGIGFLVDAAVFNGLAYWGGRGVLFEFPLVAKIISIAAASVVTYYGNHLWTYRDRRPRSSARQFLIFAVLNVTAIVLQLACLGFSRYVLKLADPVSDNISGTIIGQIVATVFRYWAYGRWAFPEQRDREQSES